MSHELFFSPKHEDHGGSTSADSRFSDYLSGLQDATLFELFRIGAAIDNKLNDPSRLAEIKRQIKVGDTISYFETEGNRCIDAVVVQTNRTRAVVRNVDDGRQWKIPLYMINLDQTSVKISETNRKGLSRNELSVGETVGFHDRNQQERYGTIVKLNPKTAKVQCENDGAIWRVSYSLLFHVIDGQSVSKNPNVIEALSVTPTQRPR